MHFIYEETFTIQILMRSGKKKYNISTVLATVQTDLLLPQLNNNEDCLFSALGWEAIFIFVVN